MMRLVRLISPFLAMFAATIPGWSPSQEPKKEKLEDVLARHLKRPKPLTVEEAKKTFQIDAGFRVELVAAEPMVYSPIVTVFDEDGRLYVAENIDYPEAPKPGQKPLGRIRLLTSTKGDGVYDKSDVFADGLQWPSSIVPWKGGVYVTAAPQLLYLKDTDGDGRADVRRVVYDGFGTEVAERVVNNLRWGLDNAVHGVTSGNGGDIVPAGADKAKALSIRGRDLRFDPRTETIELLAGNGTFGNAFDDWGNRFTSTPGMPLRQYVLPAHYIARNPALTVTAMNHNSGDKKRVMHSVSPPESWRVVRLQFWDQWVNKSHDFRSSRFPKEELTPAGFVTGAAGVEIYRGTAFPQDYRGDSFTAEPACNGLIRLKLKPNGVVLNGVAPRGDKEFLVSTDNWFRPVNVANGPDGCLYVCDMYREVIEFPSAIPDEIQKIMDVTNGRDRGRIWRIEPDGFTRPSLPKLSQATSAELVARLEHPDAWHRETAQRLLFERPDRDQKLVAAAGRLSRESKSPQGRIHALWLLEGWGAHDDASLLAALADEHPMVRAHAVRLAYGRSASPAILKRVVALTKDPDIRVRFQAAFALGDGVGEPEVRAALADLLIRDVDDRWVTTAVLSSIYDRAADVFDRVLASKAFLDSPRSAETLRQLIATIGSRGKTREVAAILGSFGKSPFAERPAFQREAMTALADAVAKSGGSLDAVLVEGDAGLDQARELFRRLLADCLRVAADEKSPPAERLAAIRFLRHGPFDASEKALAGFFRIGESLDLQLAAIQSLSAFADDRVARRLVDEFANLSPRARGEAIEAMFRGERRIQALVEALEKKVVRPTELPTARRKALIEQKNPDIRRRAEAVLAGASPANRREVVQKYQESLALDGDIVRGREVFVKNCAACHRIGNDGKNVGPDLAMAQKQSPEQLLISILDPNREVDRQFLNYVVLTKDGRSLTGIIVAEGAAAISLRRAEGVEDAISRADIEELTSSGQSLMPEGVEQQISPQQMADLIRFILSGPR